MLDVIALDLEGTLVSNAMSQIPRPGLYEFLEGCKAITDRVVIFTAVSEDVFREIAKQLVAEKVAPKWFATMEYINWDRSTKNLGLIPDNNIEKSVLVDDYPNYVHQGQEAQWVKIGQFEHPYSSDDDELKTTLDKLIKLNNK